MSPDVYEIAALPADSVCADAGEAGSEASFRAGDERSRAGRCDALGPPASGAEPELASLGFARVYDEHFAFVWRTLRLLGVAEPVLEDAAQDVFATVSNKLAEFAGRSSLRTWVFAIVQRTAANYRRSHRRKQQPLVPLSDALVGNEPTPQAHAEALEAAQAIERFCETLDAERRALFVLALLEEVPAVEIARALDVPTNTIYSRVRLLRAALERALGQNEAEHG
ncbi:MAG TPA: sigma-70 family RNA polymerase sigma factor [Polyangiaceae bacterium]|nr:sigma-70 family RNA polymerase sigma factor [Polyangiaceae bacterium]